MINKKTAVSPKRNSYHIGAYDSTTRFHKDSESQRIVKYLEPQKSKIILALRESLDTGKTASMLADTLGINDDEIRRMLAELLRQNLIWECGELPCKASGRHEMSYTSNYRVCLKHFEFATLHIWEKYDPFTQLRLQRIIKAYVVDHRIDPDFLDNDEVRRTWEDKMKPIIDGELKYGK